MSKKTSTLNKLDQAGTLLMSALTDALAKDHPPHWESAVRMAIYQVTIAKLWIVTPEAMTDASILGKSPLQPPLVQRDLSAPPPNGQPRPIK